MQMAQMGKIRLIGRFLLKVSLLFGFVVGLLLIVLFVIPNNDFTVPPTHPNSIKISESLKSQEQPPQFLFKDVTLLSGINHSHIQHSGEVNDIRDGLNAGACVADFDNDGWVDILFAAGGGQTRYYGRQSWWNSHHPVILYRNHFGSFKRLPNETFDVSTSTTACAAFDLDNDGLSDVILASTDGVMLFHNLGNFKFERQITFSQLVSPSWVSHINVLDINHDGLLDIYLSRFIRYQKNLKNLELATGFSEQHQHQFDPQSFDGLENVLLINQGKLNFIDQTLEYGLAGRQERTVSSNALDLDQDGQVELLELNSSDQPVRSYSIQDNKFKLIESSRWPLAINNSHYADSGQQPGDENPLLFFSRGAGMANIAVLATTDINTAQDIIWPSHLMHHNNIFLNYWGSVFADFNNDSKVDLVVATGGVMADPFSHQMTQASPNICASQVNENLLMPIFNTSFCNGVSSSTRSAIKLDYNNDGKMDLLLVNNNDFPQLMSNVSHDSGNWISLDIPSNNTWFAADIALHYNDKVRKMQPATRTALFGNHDPRQHFGLGNAQNITVDLYNAGKKQQQVLSANHFYQLNGDKWVVQDKTDSPWQQVELAKGDIASHIRLLFGQTITEKQSVVLTEELSQANPEQIEELANLIRQHPFDLHLELYLQWLSTNSSILEDAAAFAVGQLENEISVRYLLSHLTSENPLRFCLVANVFGQWFEQEEAVTRAKYQAIPYLMRRLQSRNAQIVRCAANALGFAEHQNSASAILAAIEHSPSGTEADLINALGKIRQKEAISFLRQRVESSADISVIQQSIIALVRLNDQDLEPLIRTMATKAQQSINLYIALYAMPTAIDNVVIDSKKRQQWLNFWQQKPSFAQLESDSQREFYLSAADTAVFTTDTLNILSASTSAQVQEIALQQRLKQELDRSNLLQISARSLNEASLKIIEKRLLNNAYTSNLEQLSEAQLTNLVIFLPLFSASQQKQILQQITHIRTLQFSPQQIKIFQAVLVRYGQKLSTQSRLSMQSSEWLEWMIFTPSDEVSLNQLGKMINQASLTKGDNFMRDLLGVSEPEWQFLPLKRLSAALLFQSDLSDELKLKWSSKYLAIDDYSKNWILTKIQTGDEASLNACLSTNCFDWLQQTIDVESLLNKVDYNLYTKNRLISFLNMRKFYLTKLKN
jgi:hypothetical protein